MRGVNTVVERPRASGHSVQMLREIFDANRAGRASGIYSVCSAHRLVLEAAFEAARADESPLLVEATCNQVNHRGGYTGMTPADFRRDVDALARDAGFPAQALILGGDHLGPNPWRHLCAHDAMREARTMVAAYVAAGFMKIHLDASMACADDVAPLSGATIAERAAQLCAAAEEAAAAVGVSPVYVIGTEVPTPGGEVSVATADNSDDAAEPQASGAAADGGAFAQIEVTRADSVSATLAAHRGAFARHGLRDAWSRVIAIVAQPGVDFDDRRVLDYDPARGAELGASILRTPPLVFEAHSTDYQTDGALAALVRDHFAILKVGPALTFALREALFALTYIEDALFDDASERSQLRDVIDAAMRERPEYWAPYYRGDALAQRLARQFSYSDRIRYYWLQPAVAAALARLFDNLAHRAPPETLVAQWLPDVYAACRRGELAREPVAWVRHRIRDVISRYARACGMQQSA
ncbi:D-tagatose-bisphosphate aldolase, class II, non-catalytic subunit [Burkholderia oklahomensis]|uniref:D-tagatose-bisphosphate aldolase, class II, non-catalytic subunit n=1 Tax=Burkholderia oklahomensis TaxID=342113 RepID=UPI00016A971D|nr:D-tagatose-bisphosphate aldolase, class II, non-catalytic subunit [Burkholderia oklahomensis]AJX33610.1 D-tagatose-bisphosphate aldolase, class II, non-catalytic subunit [Burkholderia oklahomensis C6786]AOI46936.1 tagatose-bisphosphate aldolase [Burkholderia oklahomensis C6786]KUY58409.1 tagatose-bisphosphate aldolase [Burkholderia oklahomensis C6786]MBI0360394.1 D-tagatose-bisphosphate aldolase, class II, non-catalytic subunit [Burkholderia oklahomensis]SUW59773.1 D-tagatose-1,6-bisphospha